MFFFIKFNLYLFFIVNYQVNNLLFLVYFGGFQIANDIILSLKAPFYKYLNNGPNDAIELLTTIQEYKYLFYI